MQEKPSSKIDLNPQLEQMADESMVRNLAAQAVAIWPQEVELLNRYQLPEQARIIDVGCGTGEIASRMAEHFPGAHIFGVDIIEAHIALARSRYRYFGERLSFATGDAFKLDFADDYFDLTVNRHMLQSIPFPEKVLAELKRITRPGGRLHVIAEDYGMIKFGNARKNTDDFFREGVACFGGATGTDLHIGRNCFHHMRNLGLQNICMDYVIVATVRVAREVFAAILEAWRDGFHEPIAEHTEFSKEESYDYFTAMIECVRDPDRYAVWHVPVLSAIVPEK